MSAKELEQKAWRLIEAMVGFALDRAIEATGPQAAEHFLAAMQVRLRQARV